MRILLIAVFFLVMGVAQVTLAQPVTQENTTRAKLQNVQSKADSLREKISKSTGLGVETALKPSINLPGQSGPMDFSKLIGETIPDLGLKIKEYKSLRSEKRVRKQRERLARVQYEGIPMRSLSVRYGSGDRVTMEEFHVLEEFQPIDPYVKAVNTRWYDLKDRKLSQSVIRDKAQALPLHGPYRRTREGHIIEEGFYYKGVKDGRWVTYDLKYALLSKSVWNRGFPAESRLVYYDSSHTRLKEVMPIEFGKVNGDYVAFYDGGQVMVEGKYDRGVKIGRWMEYFQFRKASKKEMQYPATWWEEDFEPYVRREWDDKGKLIIDRSKD